MEIAAGDAKSAGAFGFAPAVLAKSAHDKVALEAADFVFVGSDGSFGIASGGSFGGGGDGGLVGLRDGTHGGRELGQFDGGAVGKNDGALDDVFQFADIAGPVVLFEGLENGSGKAASFFVKSFRAALEKMMREERDVVAAFAERREMKFDDVEAVEKVLAEFALLDHVEQIAIGGGDEADIDVDSFVAAEAFERFFLKHAEKFGLQAEAEVADFVEEEGAVVGGFDAALTAEESSGKGAFFVAEEFVFDEIFGEVGAGEGDERASAAQTFVMDGAGEEFLAGAGFAGDEHVDVAGSDALGEGKKLLHGSRAAEKAVEATAAIFKSAQMTQLAFGGGHAIGAAEEKTELQDVGRVGYGIGSALFNGAQEEAAIFGVAENNDRGMGGLGVDVVEKAKANFFGGVVGMAKIEKDHVRPGEDFLELIDAGSAVGAEGKTVAQSAGDGFTQTTVVTEEADLEKVFIHEANLPHAMSASLRLQGQKPEPGPSGKGPPVRKVTKAFVRTNEQAHNAGQ